MEKNFLWLKSYLLWMTADVKWQMCNYLFHAKKFVAAGPESKNLKVKRPSQETLPVSLFLEEKKTQGRGVRDKKRCNKGQQVLPNIQRVVVCCLRLKKYTNNRFLSPLSVLPVRYRPSSCWFLQTVFLLLFYSYRKKN